MNSLYETFLARVAEAPDALALTDGDRTLTYGELRLAADRLAGQVAAHVGAGEYVGIHLPRSAEAVIAILATAAAGCAYVPLDPGYPADRLTLMAADSGVSLVLTAPGDSAPWLDERVERLEVTPTGAEPVTVGPAATDPATVAYLIYTSGSTGRPKGVAVTHANVLALLDSALSLVGAGPQDTWTMFHSYSFDFSVWELWGALSTGGRLVVVNAATARSPAAFVELITRQRVTVLNMVPSVFKGVVDAYVAFRPPFTPRVVVFGGEAFDRSAARRFLAAAPDPKPRLLNMYGITETTVHVTCHEIVDEDLTASGPTPIGRPLPHLRVHLLGPDLTPVEAGAEGEIFVSGAGVAAGYHGRPELTAERFPTVLLDGRRRRVYRSGDRARLRADGTLEYLGRTDQQVKVRGFRIEPGEIEDRLRDHDAVRDAAVAVETSERGDPVLTAYVIPTGEPVRLVPALRQHLASRLPAYMVPSRITLVADFPLTASGKLDTRRLASARPLRTELVAAGTAMLQALRELTGLPDLQGDENLFSAGVTSLQAETIVVGLASRYRRRVTLLDVLEHPTAEALEAVLARAPEWGPPEADEPSDQPPMTRAQRRFLLAERLSAGNPALRVPTVMRMRGVTDPGPLREALMDCIARHEVLRTVYPAAHQRILSPAEAAPVWEVRPGADVPAQVDALLTTPFDLDRAPVGRAMWMPSGHGTGALALVWHHIAIDGRSQAILIDDLVTAYLARARGEAPTWETTPLPYRSYACREIDALASPRSEQAIADRSTRLRGAPDLSLPGLRPEQPLSEQRIRAESVHIAAPLAHALRLLGQTSGATLHTVLLAGYAATLRLAGADPGTVIGCAVSGRSDPAFAGTVGLFANTVPVRPFIEPTEDFIGALKTTAAELAAVRLFRDLPVDAVVAAAAPRRTRRTPLFQSLFAYQDTSLPRYEIGDLSVRVLRWPPLVPMFELVLELWPDEGGVSGHLYCASSTVTPELGQRLARGYVSLLERAAADPSDKLAGMSEKFPFASGHTPSSGKWKS